VLPDTYEVVQDRTARVLQHRRHGRHGEWADAGKVLSSDVIVGVNLAGGEDSLHNDFALAGRRKLSGYVYYDANNNGLRDAGEKGIGGVQVKVQYVKAGSPSTLVTVTTAPTVPGRQGTLMPGDYAVRKCRGRLPGRPGRAATAGGTAQSAKHLIDWDPSGQRPGRAGVRLRPSPAEFDQRFRVRRLQRQTATSMPANLPSPTLEIQLLDDSGNVLRTAKTDANGGYSFTGLGPGVYGVRETRPPDTSTGRTW